ncbi:hypothetical protein WJX73_009126 [Symbiochloris irregularis]|uniref:histone acetyltransferase n=1 Tax=Symbiochloris irregularis TaxID=706552 RepID=A0AAW1P374_9CHLO
MQPEYTHQTFGQKETIRGYTGLDLRLFLDSMTFHALAQIRHEAKLPNADDVLFKLQENFPGGLAQTQAAYTEQVASASTELTDSLAKLPVVIERVDGVAVRQTTLNAADAAIKGLHLRLQPLLLFFVDGASLLDCTEPDWILLLATRKDPQGFEQVVGFTTLATFYGHPHSQRIRVSQVLVLPPYQRQGIGQLLLQAAFKVADDSNAVEVAFEDPTDQLQRLRQCVELKRALALPWLVALSSGAIASVAAQHSHTHSGTGTVNGHPANENSNGHSNGCIDAGSVEEAHVKMAAGIALSPEHVAKAQKELRMGPHQVRIAWEALLARQPGFADGPGRAALQALVERRLRGRNASVEGKKIFDKGETGWVMCRIPKGLEIAAVNALDSSEAQAQAQAHAIEELATEEGEEGGAEDIEGQVKARMEALYRRPGLA